MNAYKHVTLNTAIGCLEESNGLHRPSGVKDPRVYECALVVMMSSASLCIAYNMK